MDEIFCVAVVTRSMKKSVTFIRLDPVEHRVYHKNYVGKYMYIVVTGYEVLANNIKGL